MTRKILEPTRADLLEQLKEAYHDCVLDTNGVKVLAKSDERTDGLIDGMLTHALSELDRYIQEEAGETQLLLRRAHWTLDLVLFRLRSVVGMEPDPIDLFE